MVEGDLEHQDQSSVHNVERDAWKIVARVFLSLGVLCAIDVCVTSTRQTDMGGSMAPPSSVPRYKGSSLHPTGDRRGHSLPSFSSSLNRKYYVAADLVEWDYAPSGEDLIKGGKLTDTLEGGIFATDTDALIGSRYLKSIYSEYTDETFTQKVEKPQWAGTLGPILRAEVGDTIEVCFKNNLPDLPASMHPHGVLYTPENEGALWTENTSVGGAVPPGETFTYRWSVPARAGPGPEQGTSNVWFYHGHSDSIPDVNSGLAGPLIVYERGILNSERLPQDVDEEFVGLFMIYDENLSHYLDLNIATYGADPNDVRFEMSNLMHGVNGYIFGNLPGLVMQKGSRVRWHLASFGSEADLHTVHWHGNTVLTHGMYVDSVELLPGSFESVLMEPDSAGNWLFHCHVNHHIMAGMSAIYRVLE